ncbi:MAG: hypothetical protein CO093_11490 [Alphaproteobacteria bacterium CG_4_9_14_3_um_filter_47_13]|nr:MAG: hypothetical protein CO093_11490 [Alphaproteobacteria bacterium CG_4_9_14_3_um_filter_47_13]
MENRMSLPIVLTNKETNQRELVDIFTLGARGKGDSLGCALMIWQGSEAKQVTYKETPEEIAKSIYEAYKRTGITVLPK